MDDKEALTKASQPELERGKLPSCRAADVTVGTPATPDQLTADEQMALFEKDLKENDWGHQPC